MDRTDNKQTYHQFSPANIHRNDALVSLTTLQRYTKDQKHKKQLERNVDTQTRNSQLFDIKENMPEVQIYLKRPFMGLCCQNCTSVSRESLIKKTTEIQAIRNVLQYKEYYRKGIMSIICPQLYQVHKLKKINVCKVESLVLLNEKLKEATERASKKQFQKLKVTGEDITYEELLKNNCKRAEAIIQGIKPRMSENWLRFISYILYKILPYFVTSLIVHPGQINMVKEAQKLNVPIIFLPLYRYYLDHILISFILLNNNISPPLIATNDTLKLPVVGSMLRHFGLFPYILDKVSLTGQKDYLYERILQTYINSCLQSGQNMQFFLEKGLSKTGKPNMPNNEVLSLITESLLNGFIEDAQIVPVSINYEKLVFTESGKKPSLMNKIKNIYRVLTGRCGMVRVEFNQPFSLRELITNIKNKTYSGKSGNANLENDFEEDTVKYNIVKGISGHALFSSSQSLPVMSTNALAHLLLTKYRKGATLENLTLSFNDLRKELEILRKDTGFSGDSEYVIQHAVRMLGSNLIAIKTVNNMELIGPNTDLPSIIELSYYSNSVLPIFSMDSLIAIAISLCNVKGGSISQEELVEKTLGIFEILQYEFAFTKPCENVTQVVLNAVDDLVIRKGIFIIEQDTELAQRSRKIAALFDDEDQEFAPHYYKINNSKDVSDYLEYLRSMLLPLVETYSATAFCLYKLIGFQLMEEEFIEEVVEEMKYQLSKGCLRFGESICPDFIKNAVKLYKKWGLIECYNESHLQLYFLNEKYNNLDSVKENYYKICKYQQYIILSFS